jgi:ATP-binding cassette subfamily B protein RaxB
MGRLPVILQAERSECALACLAMVLVYHGHNIAMHTLRARCHISVYGSSLKTVLGLASEHALAARPLRLDLAELKQLSLPAILHWKLDHFVILKKVSRTGLEIHDPAAGFRQVGWQEAGGSFTGVAVELTPTDKFIRNDQPEHLSLAQLWHCTNGFGSWFLQLLVLSLLLQVFALTMPFYTQIILDDVLLNGDRELLTLLASGFFLLVVCRQVTDWLRGRIILYLGSQVGYRFATRLCRHLLGLPLTFFSRRHIGDIVSRFGSLTAVRDFLCSGMVEAFIDGLMVIGAMVMMLCYNGPLSLISMVAVLLYALVRLLAYTPMRYRQQEWLNGRAAENTYFLENIRAIQDIKLFSREPLRLSGWQNQFATALNGEIKTKTLGLHVQLLQGLLTGLTNILLLFMGARAVMEGELSVGMLLAFISFKDHFYRSVFSLLDKYFEYRLLDVHLDRLSDIAFAQAEVEQIGIGHPVLPGTAELLVSLQNLGYGYEPGQPLLFDEVNLQLTGKQKVAIIGPTGCGKSTLLKIIAGLVMPAKGQMLVNNAVLVSDRLSGYRSAIAAVMQNDTLLSGTVLENVTFFDESPDLDRFHEAIEQAALSEELARLPMQYFTMVGSMGAALSGGQIQRLLLARALYRQPRLLILDEATSHLDVLTESRVTQAVKRLGIPCVMVAHRPESVMTADRIYWLDQTGLHQVTHEQFAALISDKKNSDVITI